MEGCSVKESNNMSFTDYSGTDAVSEYFKLKRKLALTNEERANMVKPKMNDEIRKYKTYGLTYDGELVPVPIYTTDDYNHATHQLHHYIKQQSYIGNEGWYKSRGIEQKLILLPIWLHLIVHNSPSGCNLTDEEFENRFNISRHKLLFNSKKWREGLYD